MEFKGVIVENDLDLSALVLIESDWNLKVWFQTMVHWRFSVLIESDWNLKVTYSGADGVPSVCINRIRLEFKV